MKAWLLDSLTGLQTLRLADIPDPIPAEGEVLLQLDFAALNPADRYLAENQYPAKPTFPHTLGRDGTGTVLKVGPNVKDWKPNDRATILRSDIGVNRPGTFAQFVAVPADSLVPAPPNWTPEQAAGATLVYLTAYQALTMWADLPDNPTVLITGASGGVGVASLHLAKALGHTTVCLSRSPEKQQTLQRMGAHFTFDPTDPAWPQQLKSALTAVPPHSTHATRARNPRVDLAIDNIGGREFNQLLETLGPDGRISCVGRLAGPVPQFNTASLFFRRLKIGGVAVGAYTRDQAHHAWTQVLQLLNQSGQRPVIDHVFDFTQLSQAFARLAQGPMGKVLLRIPH